MTPKERAAMQQALEALEMYRPLSLPIKLLSQDKTREEAITALREALAKQSERVTEGNGSEVSLETEAQEPVAFVNLEWWMSGSRAEECFDHHPHDTLTPLYAAPVRTKDLTDDEIKCACGDLFPADSFGAGFIAATGCCQNCDVVLTQKIELSNEEIATIARETTGCCIEHEDVNFARAVIAAYKEKNK